MTDHGDRLRAAFESRESHTPDPGEVYARVVELSRKHKWRRRGATVAGGTALGAGLIAAVVNLPAVLPGGQQDGTAATAPIVAAAPASPSASPEPTREWDAYWGAGYGYEEAVELAKLWNLPTADIGAVKAEAGRRLLAGQTLPVRPTRTDEIPDAVTEFFSAGYGYDDAVKLAKLWKLKTPYDAKVAGGEKLLAGKKLPFKPNPATAEENQESVRVDAFFNAGYDYDDAVKLAKLWKLKTPYDAKVAAGKRLLAGETLPIKP
ncbi:hypothetical protein [Actinoplanes siamensis]|uniref:Uncharacterized protein n=1 Tax=Actinoplanes siamensis TaxID=1223317 RepID=A0A919TLN0_9ACTN|nr:hypothetical protein [Actinoplanes siamensis]GIF06579.1 hypothetical protein Asi03nite_41170 [Actinoplanes siamensis]